MLKENNFVTGYLDVNQYKFSGEWVVGETYNYDKVKIRSINKKINGFLFFPESPLKCLQSALKNKDNSKNISIFKIASNEEDILFNRGKEKVSRRVKLLDQLTVNDIIATQIEYAEKSGQYQKCQRHDSSLAFYKNSKKILASGCFHELAISGSENTVIFNKDIVGSLNCSACGRHNTIVTNGEFSTVSTSGENTKVISNGEFSRLSSSGYLCDLIASAYGASVAASGDRAFLNTNGKYSRLVASGDGSRCSATGEDNIIAAVGRFSHVNGAMGTYVCIADYDNAGTCRGFVTGRIGENGLKPYTTYTVKNGRFVEVTEDEVVCAISV